MVSERSGPASIRPPRGAWFDPVRVPGEKRRMSMAMPVPQGDQDAPAVPADRLPFASEPSATAPGGPPGTGYTSKAEPTIPSTPAPPAPEDAERIPESPSSDKPG